MAHLKEEILKGVKYETWPKRVVGGQQTNGPIIHGIRAYHDDFPFEVCCHEFRTQLQNQDICYQAFELFVDIYLTKTGQTK